MVWALCVLAVGWTVRNAWTAISLFTRAPTEPALVVEAWRDTVYSDKRLTGTGSARGDVVVFSDYYCQACQRFFAAVSALQADNNGAPQIEWLAAPMDAGAGVTLSTSVECAARQGRFVEAHRLAFAIAQQNGGPDGESPPLMRQLPGIDTVAFRFCVDSGDGLSRVLADRRTATGFGLEVTPILIVNDSIYPGMPYDYKRLLEVPR